MAETSSSAIGTYGEGVKWLVGLSASVVAGAFLHLKEIDGQPLYLRILIAAALILFFVSIWSGINYLLWLNAVGADRERIKESREELRGSVTEKEKLELERRIDRSKGRIGVSETAMPPWHQLYTYTFAGGLAISMLSITLALIVAPTPRGEPQSEKNPSLSKNEVAIAPTSRFHLGYSAVHQTSHGKEAHTFLVDDQTGRIWQMMCMSKDEVTFKQVHRTDENIPTK
jgi:hypothetical protein